MIYTTYFANIRNLPPNIIPIAISLYVPEFYTGLRYTALAPDRYTLARYKMSPNERHYSIDYTENVLKHLNPHTVVDDLYKLSNGNDVALVCYEKAGKFCHRKIVSLWLNYNGIECKEFYKEEFM